LVDRYATLYRKVDDIADVHLVAPFILPVFVHLTFDFCESKDLFVSADSVEYQVIADADVAWFGLTEVYTVFRPPFRARLVRRPDHFEPCFAHGSTSPITIRASAAEGIHAAV
jgi:hypothetical protein